jgi:hypothetical protein
MYIQSVMWKDNNFERILQVLNCGIFNRENVNNPLFWSAFIELVIRLNEALQKVKKDGKEIRFNDDIPQNEGEVNITDLINKIRHSVCHLGSGNIILQGDKSAENAVSFSVLFGKATVIRTPHESLGSKYEDDVMFIFGSYQLYLKRHIHRAFLEALDVSREMSKNPL